MELRHLKFVVALAEELHFGKAAARLNMSQPPLSRQIRQLEEELGVRLFRRTRRWVEVTEAGKIFAIRARQILAETEHAQLAAQSARNHDGELSIGFMSPTDCGIGIVLETLQVFCERYPDMRITLHSMNSTDQIQALRAGAIQVGFLKSSPVNDPTLKTEVILREPLIVALSTKSRLANRKQVPLIALADEPLILFPRHSNPDFYDLIVEAYRTVGLSLDVTFEVENTSTALALVGAGLGVSLLSPSVRDVGWRGVVFRDLQALLPWTEIAVAYTRDSAKMLSPFLEVVRRVAAKKSEYSS